jgi:hypothetical protein
MNVRIFHGNKHKLTKIRMAGAAGGGGGGSNDDIRRSNDGQKNEWG